MALPLTTKNKLIKSIEKLDGLDQMPDLMNALVLLKRTDTFFQPNDHRKIIQFVLMAMDKYPDILQNKNNKSNELFELCTDIMNDATTSPTPSRSPR